MRLRPIVTAGTIAKNRLQREALKTQLRAAAAHGEPAVSDTELEEARRTYMMHLEHAKLAKENDRLGIDERAERASQHLAASELDRINYEHRRQLYEAQKRRAAEDEARKLTLANIEAAEEQAEAAQMQAGAARAHKWIAIVVGVLVAAQTLFLVKQYLLSKWLADHPPPAVSCPR